MKLVIIAALTLSCLVVNIGAAPAGTNVDYVKHFPSAYTISLESDSEASQDGDESSDGR